MSDLNRLKVITAKNREAVELVIKNRLKDKVYTVDRTAEGLVIVDSENEKYAILVGYDQTGKTVYSTKRMYTKLEIAQMNADSYSADHILETFLRQIGTVEAAEDALEAWWVKAAENRSVHSINYYGSNIASKEGYLKLVQEIYATVEYLKTEKSEIETIEILQSIQSYLLEMILKYAQYGAGISNDYEQLAVAEKVKKAADFSNTLKWNLKSYEKAMIGLMNTKEGE